MTHPPLIHHPVKVQTAHGQHAHALSYACFFKAFIFLYCHHSGWIKSVHLCLQCLYMRKSLDAGHLCRCVIDFEIRVCVCVWSLYSMSTINNVKIGHFYLLYQVHLDTILFLLVSVCYNSIIALFSTV